MLGGQQITQLPSSPPHVLRKDFLAINYHLAKEKSFIFHFKTLF